ncbi:protein meiotic P26-like [Oculina patagonica]
MSERSLKDWFKLAFHLFVTEQWEKVKETVEDNDATYRWLKEQILREVSSIEAKAFRRSFISMPALNLRDRLISLKYVNPDEDTFNKVKFWLKDRPGSIVLKHSDNSTEDRVNGCKIALLEASFIYFDEPEMVANCFRSLLINLYDVDGVYSALEEKDNPSILAQVKVINDAAANYILSLGQELGDWREFPIPAEALPTVTDYTPPEIWCFGDFGQADGQMSYPEKVAINKEGQFLVMEEDITGVGDIVTTQRIQLFSPKGKFLRCLLKRGEGKVNGMTDFCLTKDGNILVGDEDEDRVNRIQIFDYDGKQLLQIAPEIENPEDTPNFRSLAVDADGKVIAGDITEMCVYIFAPDGKTVCKFGKRGRGEGEFQTVSNVACDDAGKIYVSDSSLNRIQVFDAEGNFQSMFGPSGTYLRYMLFDTSRGEVYGSDYENHNIKVYTMAGELLRGHGKRGTALNECDFPYGLALMTNGKVAIAERENHRITVLKI